MTAPALSPARAAVAVEAAPYVPERTVVDHLGVRWRLTAAGVLEAWQNGCWRRAEEAGHVVDATRVRQLAGLLAPSDVAPTQLLPLVLDLQDAGIDYGARLARYDRLAGARRALVRHVLEAFALLRAAPSTPQATSEDQTA